MSTTDTSGFGKFVPGFEFLQNLAKSAGQSVPHMPNLASWVAPTLNPEELDKRIEELKSVQFWLEQNSRALSATIQALEVQKMTLATLKGMNFNLGDVGKTSTQATSKEAPKTEAKPPSDAAAAGLVDPLKLWGSLTQQFQNIAATALQETANAAKQAPAAAKAASKRPAARKAATKKPAAR